MSVPFSNTKLRVPNGFQSLLENFAREVLRSQPQDIYTFGAMYFEELVRRKEETGEEDISQLTAKVEDRFYNNKAFQQPTVDPSDPQQQDASKVIQTNYRRFAAQKEASKRREDKAASDIQSAVRGHQEREAVRETSQEETQQQQQEEEEEVDIDLNDPEVAAAAEKIQAGFKGFKTRREFNARRNNQAAAAAEDPTADVETADANADIKQSLEDEDAEKEDQEPESAEDRELAAVKIQASFKGYKTRKEMNERRENADQTQEEEEKEEEEAEEEDQEPESAEDREQAAVKIQASFKGYKTRKEMNVRREAAASTERID